MWKQDIGQWVERKGRRGWVKQQQQQQQSTAPTLPVRHACFLPEGFEDRCEDVTLMPDVAANTVHLNDDNNKNNNGAVLSPAGERWVAVYGASPESIMNVREFLDVMFGRTVSHYYPLAYASSGSSELTPILAGGQNWFYVKFEDPVSAARAVYQSPLTISMAGGHGNTSAAVDQSRGAVGPAAREEVVGVTWCTDARFLQKERETEQKRSETQHLSGVSTETYCNRLQRTMGDIKNTSGVTPRGAERLHRTPPPSHRETRSGGRLSRGLGTLLYDALRSPWHGRWTGTQSRDGSSPRMGASTSSGSLTSSSPTHTEVFHEEPGAAGGRGLSRRCANQEVGAGRNDGGETLAPTGDITVPSCLYSRRGRCHHYDAARQLHGVIPVRPLRGNESVLSVFRADAAERRLIRRVFLALARLPSRISRLLVSPALWHENPDEAAAAADDSQWLSMFGGFVVDRRSGQQRQLLRNRHYNAAARFIGVNGGYGETPVIAAWTPYRWYERSSVVSLVLCLFLFIVVFFSGLWGDGAAVVDVATAGRWSNDTAAASAMVLDTTYDGSKYAAPRLGDGQLQGTMFADGIYASDRYTARTL
ncbi:hypothetical protein TraAM80_06127 [Trypanosoma rangeli]|uniref:Uncharacterized protein n=1 Tax=Trypanosoma rangeli TaxID=5698 RepID=A0A3R7RHP9_TRYRA|nr:uncharacterized protein TraAM80_06127 [Trypanosoma rangeli]RNF02834.1 hypothetical protein TraAM80_06127 [Trypanosoma rangeli]|eukprot:RNF02834.1 hypothetical protein TraAM80_06127 [Trypanosoma rangeli]